MITRIHSATVVVRDQDAALDFYTNTLGFEKRADSPYGEGSRWIEVAPPGRETAIALVSVRDVEQMGGDPADRYKGLSLIADDVQATYDQLSARGVEFTEPPQRMPWGSMATWFKDPDGNTFFLTEA